MNQLQLDPRAVSAGLLMPSSPSDEEPRLTDAGLFFVLGAMAYEDDADDDTRGHHLAALKRVLNVAKKHKDFPAGGEALLLALLKNGIDPLDNDDKSKLLLMICRLVALCVGRGRMRSLIADEYIH